MALKNGDAYRESIRALRLSAHVFGSESADLTENPLIRPSLDAVAATYDGAHEPENRELFTAHSDLIGERVNRFTHLQGSPEDLVSKVRLLRECGARTACCFQRCVGLDAGNALFSVTFDCDARNGTGYHPRFRDYWSRVQREDLVVDGAMTDPKGDRSRRPSAQKDPDLYLRVVERRADGVVVRGAKLHQTGMLNSHEVIVMPTAALRAGEEDWAIAFALPSNTPGIRYVLGRQSSDTRRREPGQRDAGNPCFGGHEAFTLFDDVFVPRERIFLDGEVEFAGLLVERFAAYHRQSYGGCKPGVGDALIGAAALIARMNGVEGASHVRDKLVEMVHLNETLYSAGIAASALGHATAAGTWEVDTLLANVCKQNVTRLPWELARLATDLAGGLVGTLPPLASLSDPELGPVLRKYLAASDAYDVEERLLVLRLIENLVIGAGAVGYLVESVHGAGSPAAQRVLIGRTGGIDEKVERARKLLGLAPDRGSAGAGGA